MKSKRCKYNWSSMIQHLALAWRRMRTSSSSSSTPGPNDERTILMSSRSRLAFILVAFLFLAIAAFLLLLAMVSVNTHTTEPQPGSSKLLWRLRSKLNNHRTTVIFLSSTFAALQVVAIGAALFNWSTVLFSYVIITGIFGTMVGVVGIVGIVFTCILMRHETKTDHTIAITIGVLVAFVFVFYLLTLLGVRLMDYFRKRNRSKERASKSLSNLRFDRKRRTSSMYRSIDSLSLPISRMNSPAENGTEMDDIDLSDEQQTQSSLLSAVSSSFIRHQV